MLSLQSQTSWLSRAQCMLGAAMVLLSVGFYVFAYRPQIRRIAELNDQIFQQQRELLANQAQTRTLPVVQEEVNRLKVRLNKVKVLPRQQELAAFIKDIGQLVQQASLKKPDIRQGVSVRGEQINQLPIQMTFEGDFVSVFSFLRHTEELQRLTRVPEMSIKSKDRQGQVKVQLTMNIYFAAE